MAETHGPRSDADWSIRRVLEWAAGDFKKRGFDSPRLDAELLLARALGVDRMRLILDAEHVMSEGELTAYRALIQRRRRAEPIAYILGEREFYGFRFRVDSRVLVPRPDTEALVDVALSRTRTRSLFGRALDLCTGSGAVAIAFAKRRPSWRMTATDVSRDALDVARDNALRLGAVFGVRFVQSDLDAALAEDERFELVTANPPYIPSTEIAGLQADVRDFEPRLALDGGADGLAVVRRVIEAGPRRLSPGGVLAVEVGAGQARTVAELFERASYENVDLRCDYGGIERVVSGTYG